MNDHETTADHEAAAEVGWPAPIPLDDHPVPEVPTTGLPPWFAAFAAAMATETQTPLDLPVMIGFAALAAALAKKVEVRANDGGWVEPVNLYVAAALESGTRKSAVLKAMIAPITAGEEQAARGTGSGTGQSSRRLLADDATPERLATLLADNGGRLAILAPEGNIFGDITRYANTPNLGVYLRAHDGETLRIDRVTRSAVVVPRPALTIGICVQPGVVAGLARPGFRETGFLARFLYATPPSTVGRRDPDPPAVPAGVRDDYRRNLDRLLEMPAAGEHNGEPVPHRLVLSSGARQRLVAFARELEPRLGEAGDLGPVGDWGGKLTGALIRIAGLLQVAGRAVDPEPWAAPIGEETMETALRFGPYLAAHALAAFGAMGADPDVANARYLLRWLAKERLTEVTKNEMYQGTKGRFRRTAALDRPLALLVERGYLWELPAAARSKPGRRSSQAYAVHPAAA